MAPRWCMYIALRWRLPKAMYGLIALEIPLTIALLALFGIADPNTYRTKLWQNGSNQGFNSDPSSILYEYANYETVHVPLIWSSFTTQFNIVCSVLSLFILLVKSMMFVLGAFIPALSVFVHALLIALYAVSVRNQSSPDLSNTKVPNLSRNLPWYLEKGCSFASDKNKGYCMQARAAFALSCVTLALFVAYLAFSIYSCIPTPAEKDARRADYDEEIELKHARYTMDPDAGLTKEEKWERNRQIFLNLPKTPHTPGYGGMPAMTPRTTAFSQLTGAPGPARPAPARSGSSYGSAGGTATASKPLAFRQQFEYGEVSIPDPI